MLDLVCAEMDPQATFNGRTLDEMRSLRREREERRVAILAGGPVTFRLAGIPRRVLGEVSDLTWASELLLDEDDHLSVVAR